MPRRDAPPRVALRRLGFHPLAKPPRRPRTPPKPFTPAELHERDCERAFRTGARYSRNRWVRRAPPRMALPRPGDGGFADALRRSQAFYRGYDTATRARYALSRHCFWSATP